VRGYRGVVLRETIRGVPVWVIAVALAIIVCGAVAAYIFATVMFPVEVKEPLSVVAFPVLLSLYPNMTEYFNVTINNAAAVNYLVSLAFVLNDTAYQQSYVTFSSETYTVAPDLNNLTAWINVAADAPPAQLELAVGLSRVSEVQPNFGYTFTWTNETQNLVNGTLTMKLNFTITEENLLITAQINATPFYHYYYALGIIIDQEFDGFHVDDQGYILTSDNRSYAGISTRLAKWWSLQATVYMPPTPSPYHYCTFSKLTGYTYHVKLPISVIPEKTQYGQALRAHVDFGIIYFVNVEFSLEKNPLGYPE
jgi:hypothetical protein